MIAASNCGVVAHCVETFPKLSETFIHGKIAWLQENGYAVRVIDKWKTSRQYNYFSASQCQLFQSISSSLYPYRSRLSNRLFRWAKSVSPLSHLMLTGRAADISEIFYDAAGTNHAPVQEMRKAAERSMNTLHYYDFCRRNAVSVAHVHFGFNALEWIPVKRILGKHLRLIVSMLGKDLTVIPREQPRIYERLFAHADLFLVSSVFLKRLAMDLGCPEEKLIVHPVEIDTEFFCPGDMRSASNKVTILSVGRLVWEKDYDTALKAMSLLQNTLPDLNWQYRIVGEGPLRGEIQTRLSALELNHRVFLVGSKTHDEVRREMQSAEVFFMPSVSEGLGGSALEAAACGLPVVASRAGGLQEAVIDDHTGLLAEAGDAEGFARRIAHILSSDRLRQTMGNYGRAHVVAGYSAEMLYRRLPEYYWGCYDTPSRCRGEECL